MCRVPLSCIWWYYDCSWILWCTVICNIFCLCWGSFSPSKLYSLHQPSHQNLPGGHFFVLFVLNLIHGGLNICFVSGGALLPVISFVYTCFISKTWTKYLLCLLWCTVICHIFCLYLLHLSLLSLFTIGTALLCAAPLSICTCFMRND
jgi:hypothetical protein